MNLIIKMFIRLGILKDDLDYHLVRASMTVIFLLFSFIATSTIIPFMPDGWAASAGGFPAMTERVAFLIKDLVLFAASFYLLKQDVVRVCSMEAATEILKGALLKERPETV